MSIVDTRNRTTAYCTLCSSIEESDDLSSRTQQIVAREIRFERTLSFINGLNFPVDVIDRNGGMVRLPDGNATQVSSTKDLVVYVSYKFSKCPNFDPFNLMDEAYVSARRELKLVRDFINRNKDKRRSSNGSLHVTIKYTIKQDEFNRNGDHLYFKDLDQLFSIACDPRNIPTHPYSTEGMALRKNQEVDYFKHHIIINDPRDEFGPRYVNIAGKAYRIPVSRDPLNDPGVYIEGTVPAEEQYATEQTHYTSPRSGMDRVQKRYYNWMDAAKLGIFYLDQATAETLGDPQAIFKREIESQKNEWLAATLKREQEFAIYQQETKEKEQDWKEKELTHKAAMAEKERELKELELQQKEKYMNMDYRARIEKQAMEDETNVRSKIMTEDKYHMEKRKHENNTVLDLLKWVPAAIVAAAGATVAFLKFAKPLALLLL